MNFLDIMIQNYFSLVRTPIITEIMYVISRLFDASIYFILITLSVAFLVYKVRSIQYSILFLSSLSCGGASVYFLKWFFDVSRPVDSVVSALGQSFPSYHATVATIFFIMLMYIFDDYFSGFWRVVFNLFCLFMVSLVWFSRLYLGVHWVSDVAGGILLGVGISFLAINIFKYRLEYA